MDTLIINSYAGSLVLGARDAGANIIGSFEDSGFGIEAQKLNFPKLKYVDRLPWPKQDLSKAIVISHPPCAAFSNQNNSMARKGLATDAFKCHRNVMDYALGNRCAGLAIESVPGLLKYASIYQDYAKKNRYFVYFVYLNSATFGVPQWRPRVWVLFFRDVGKLVIGQRRDYKTIQDILEPESEVMVHPVMRRLLDYFGKKFRSAGFDFDAFMKYENTGSFVPAVAEFLGIENDRKAVDARTGTSGLFGVRLPRKLKLDWFSPVVLDGSFFFANGRPLTIIEYQRIVGFPDNFKWPQSMALKFLVYLSKGVSPPVARWIVDTMTANIAHTARLDQPNLHIGTPGDILDIRPNEAEAREGIIKSRNLNLNFGRKGEKLA